MELKDWLNSINVNKQNLIEGDKSIIKDYPPYIVNKCLSAHYDAILFANEMNISHYLDKDLQYHFYLHGLRKRKRYSPWLKKSKIEYVDYVKTYYGFSNEKAVEALKILNKEQLNFIKNTFEIGGKHDKSNN